ncbi:Sec61p translocation complex subunit [Entomortierella beljakovae]|nr:Sec61p translocation complex subunit [Entomortierella beljakovae]
MDNEFAQTAVEGPKQFVKDGIAFINRCTKPDRKEFLQITQAVSMGFFVMGVIGFVVKLIHIPINNILVNGYQPSIFLDNYPKQHCLIEQQCHEHHGQHSVIFDDDEPEDLQPDIIQIWLDFQSTRTRAFSSSSHFIASPLQNSVLPTPYTPPQNTLITNHQPLEELSLEDDDESMEWESCLSSPLAQTVPDMIQRSVSPLQALDVSHDPQPETKETKSEQLTLAFQKHTMLPRLPFRGRCQSIFLAAETSNDDRMHRRVKDLLHNTSVQRIRSWLKSTVEPCALEQWRNISLMDHLNDVAAVPKEDSCNSSSISDGCPICFKAGTIMKEITTCGHSICWKCEQDLNRAGNIACPLCRRIRLTSTYKSVADMFRTTIGIHRRDYIHEYPLLALEDSAEQNKVVSETLVGVESNNCRGDDYDVEETEHELSDRYLWEQSNSFLEYLQPITSCPMKQYFQLNAVQDLCFKPSTEEYLPEYNDQVIIEPPTSGLVLPAHRLYIALIHFCIDMLTLPKLPEFQLQQQFKREAMTLELITLFLVPTDEFSPRGPNRIYNALEWIEHGQYILARIYRVIQSKVRRHMRDLAGDDAVDPDQGVPSTAIPRHILYLGVERWTWIAQSLCVILTWLQAAQSNPSMVPPVANWSIRSSLGKRSTTGEENPRPVKKRRLRRRNLV